MSKDKFAAATARPWTLTPKPHAAWIGRIGNNRNDPEIWTERVAVPGKTYIFGDKLVDATLIVTAVNAHDELVAALTGMVSGYDPEHAPFVALERAKALLRRLGVEEQTK